MTLTSLFALVALLAWPYVSLWHLDRAVLSADPTALSTKVDLDRIRQAIKQKLNKDSDSTLGDFSDGFVQWLERGFRIEGQGAVDRIVTLDWVRDQLSAKSMPGEGFLPQVTYAFFDDPTTFRVSLETEDQQPIHIRLQLIGVSWQVSALYH